MSYRDRDENKGTPVRLRVMREVKGRILSIIGDENGNLRATVLWASGKESTISLALLEPDGDQ